MVDGIVESPKPHDHTFDNKKLIGVFSYISNFCPIKLIIKILQQILLSKTIQDFWILGANT
jgi:hypothetical protein